VNAYIPEVISSAEQEVGFGEERRADLAETTVTARAFQAVLVPVAVERPQQIALSNDTTTARTLLHASPNIYIHLYSPKLVAIQ